jgi:DNA-binding LacI/PurR family transcriptional regulator
LTKSAPGKLTGPSMADVGKLAKVSAQTVSRYFNGTGYVSKETKLRIAEAVKDLGYVPNRAARSLRTSKSNTVGVLLVGSLNFGASGVLQGIARAARDRGFSIVITQLDLNDDVEEGWEAEAIDALHHLLGSRVDGVIISSPIEGVERVLDGWTATVPIVVATESNLFTDAAKQSGHSFRACLLATKHMIGLGHTKILHVAGPTTRIEARERIAGYRSAMREAGLPELISYHAKGWTASSGYEAAQMCESDTFTAVVAANDEIALGFIHAMEERGLKAPVDYSVTGIDDMPEASHFSPPLTTVSLDFQAMGERIFAILEHKFNAVSEMDDWSMHLELKVRCSTAEFSLDN